MRRELPALAVDGGAAPGAGRLRRRPGSCAPWRSRRPRTPARCLPTTRGLGDRNTTSGNHGVASGNQVNPKVTAPVTVDRNAVGVAGNANPS
ncbi:hypothetical protein GTS_38170 [Gandjariella thermophila]|uniref:Chaplin domain-containing protein n=1 Tax=Gandjariella thermophila TaxID=1931992 RepID=A0A4D4J9F3_9PSEU|nr:hypothetical protein GTS_38170 [Gandjariella thermophila]